MFSQRKDSNYKIETTAVSGNKKAFDVEIKKPQGGDVVRFRVLAAEVITRKNDNSLTG